eukprot:g2403.t1
MSSKVDEEHARKYTGLTRTIKLIHVGTTTSWESVSEDVFKDIQDTKNVGLYDMLRKDKMTSLPTWSEAGSVRDAIEKDIATFERKIDMARNDREEEMDFQIKCGDYMMNRYLLQEASLKFTRALEIARSVQGSNQKSIETMKKLMVACAVAKVRCRSLDMEIRNVTSDIQDEDKRMNVVSYLKAGQAVVSMCSGDYRSAANLFCDPSCSIAMKDSFKELVLAENVSIYGSVCAVAEFSRSEMRKRLIENDVFKDFLDSSPNARDLCDAYFSSDYTKCMSALDKIETICNADALIASHWPRLKEKILDNMMIQYFRPFSRASMKEMSKAFGMSMDEIETRASKLIVAKKMAARIDSQNKIMIAKHVDERTETFDRILTNGEAFVADVQTAMLRLSLRESGLHLKQQRNQSRGMMNMMPGGMGRMFGRNNRRGF